MPGSGEQGAQGREGGRRQRPWRRRHLAAGDWQRMQIALFTPSWSAGAHLRPRCASGGAGGAAPLADCGPGDQCTGSIRSARTADAQAAGSWLRGRCGRWRRDCGGSKLQGAQDAQIAVENSRRLERRRFCRCWLRSGFWPPPPPPPLVHARMRPRGAQQLMSRHPNLPCNIVYVSECTDMQRHRRSWVCGCAARPLVSYPGRPEFSRPAG